MSTTSALPDHLRLFEALLNAPTEAPADDTTTIGVQTIDPAVYVDAARFDAERATLFRRYPVPVAHISELPEAGSVLTHDHLGTPILLVRDRDGVVRAFLNACRHRHTKLVEPAECGRKASIVCRYHAWAYGLDGALVNIPCVEQFPGIDKREHGLVALPVAVRGGLIFVVPEPGAALDIDAHLGSIAADLDAFGVGSAVVFRKVEETKRFNWKLVVDAFTDGYHIQFLHRHTIAPFFAPNCSRSERVGNHLRAVVARAPFAEARGLPPERWDIRQHATYSHYIFPNMVTIMHPDYVSLITLYPKAPGKTVYVHTLLTPRAPQDEKERDHYERSFELIEGGVFQAEDLDVCARAQAAMEGGARSPMLLGTMETAIAEFHRVVDAAVARG